MLACQGVGKKGDVLRLRQMDTQDTATARQQGFVIAEGLGADQSAEAHAFIRDVHVGNGIRDDLDEQAAIRAALVELPGGMLKARAEAGSDGAPGLLTDGDAQLLQGIDGFLVAGQIGIDGDVIAGRWPA